MPRDGSGNYTLPAGTAAVANTTIESAKYNDFIDDVASALSGSIAADGQKPFSGNQPMGGNKLTGLGAGSANGDSVRYEQSPAGILTTRGDLIRRGASAPERVAVGTSGQFLMSDGTDPAWTTVTGADIKLSGTNLIATQPVLIKNNIDYTILTTDRNKVIQSVSSSTTRVMTMPTAADAGTGWSASVMNVAQSTYTTTIAATTGNFFGAGYNNATTITLSPGESITLTSDGVAFYVTNFVRLNIAGRFLARQTFTSSGTYTPNSRMAFCDVTILGAGGAGGSVNSTARAAGGSGAGVKVRFTAAQIGASKAVTIGAGGTGVSSGVGNPGNSSSLGSLVVVGGGAGGTVSSSGGAGGTVSTGGDINVKGRSGSGQNASIINDTKGGDSPFGLGTGGEGLSSGNGVAGSGYGSGGSAASTGTSGAGGAGICIIEEYS